MASHRNCTAARTTLRPQCNEVLLQHPQVQAQVIKLLHVAQRDIDVSDLVLDLFQAREFLVDLGARQAGDAVSGRCPAGQSTRGRSCAGFASA